MAQVASSSSPGGATMTIDDLARAARTTTRNVRNYAGRGMLPPALMRGRVAYYGPEHLARLRVISALQKKGYSLAAIADVLAAWRENRPVTALLGLESAVTAPMLGEQRVVSRAELERMLPNLKIDDELLIRAGAYDLLTLEPGGYRLLNEPLLKVGNELATNGVSPEVALVTLSLLRSALEPLAKTFVDLVRDVVWKPFVNRGSPADELPEIAARIERIKPLAFAATEGALAQELDRAIDDALPAVMARGLSKEPPGRKRGPKK